MSSSIWQVLVNKGHWAIMKAVGVACGKVSDFLAAKVVALNAMIATEGPNTWMTDIISPLAPLNMTATTYPRFDSDTGLISMNFDGRFMDVIEKAMEVPVNAADSIPREKKQKEQFFLHESTLNSLLFDLSDSYMPINVESEAISASLLQVFHEFAIAYGPDVQLSLGVKLSEDHNTNAIDLDTEKGIIFGSIEKESMTTILQFYCTNAKVTDDLAIVLEMNMQAYLDLAV